MAVADHAAVLLGDGDLLVAGGTAGTATARLAEGASTWTSAGELLADEPGKDGVPKVCGKYGVWQEKSMYGRTYMGVVRTTYLIGPDGKVARRWDKVKVPGHAEAVLEEIRSRFA